MIILSWCLDNVQLSVAACPAAAAGNDAVFKIKAGARKTARWCIYPRLRHIVTPPSARTSTPLPTLCSWAQKGARSCGVRNRGGHSTPGPPCSSHCCRSEDRRRSSTAATVTARAQSRGTRTLGRHTEGTWRPQDTVVAGWPAPVTRVSIDWAPTGRGPIDPARGTSGMRQPAQDLVSDDSSSNLWCGAQSAAQLQ